ncbi:MAG: PAS domain-containing protein [Kiritimatiellae bacterium]|nr:PAS domain-containing protein [Kiritimatiellia bacterium]
MADKDLLSRTMRIDLIPNVPSAPVGGDHKPVVIYDPDESLLPADGVAAEAIDGSARYDELFQSVYDAAVVTDLNGVIVDANVRAVEFLLYERTDLCGLNICDIISGADTSLIGTLIDNLDEKRFTVIQAYCLRKDESLFPGEIAVNKLRLGTMHLCFFIRDVTVRKHAEEMLVTEHNAIQNAINGIAITNINLQLEYSNPAMASMWGYENADVFLDQDARGLFDDYDSVSEQFNTVIEDGVNWVQDMKAKKHDGTIFDVQVSAACNRNSDGDIVGVVFSVLDINDRKRAEDAERQAEQQRVMLESLGAACHHLGQPATILLANLSFMKMHLKDADEAVKEVVQGSIEAMDRLGKILHRLNAVNEYKTTEYLSDLSGDDSGNQSRILEI